MSYTKTADFTVLTDGKILPYIIELDEDKSVLTPAAGENQKFVYNLTAKGGGNSEHMTSFVFGINKDIQQGQVKNIFVIIGGVAQSINFGTNVKLVSETSGNGYFGLLFDFGLNKNNGAMQVGFELSDTHKVGNIPVHLHGDGITKTGLHIGGPFAYFESEDPDDGDDEPDESDECFDKPACKKSETKEFDVSLPVIITPYAIPGEPVVNCVGDAEFEPGIREFDDGEKSFEFTLIQRINVEIPVDFGSKVCYDEVHVEGTGEKTDDD